MRNGNERNLSPLDCDVGLGLRMPLQPTECYTSGGALFSYTSSRVADCAGDIHQPANSLTLPRSFQNTAFGAPVGMSGKALFTDSQWQEFERQNMIHQYLSIAVPVPHQLLLSSSTTSTLPQCNIAPGLELRFGTSGSTDPEPWRCKRTDGKKWRCSRDVAPDHKYCERHAHKTKSRSRKHVEITSNPLPVTNRSTSHLSPSMASATSFDQTRSMEWFMRGGGSSNGTTTTPVPASKQQQWRQQQITQIPPDKDNASNHNKNESSLYQPTQDYDKDNQGFYVPDTSNLHKHHKIDSSHTTHTTRHFFVDSWEKDIGFDMGLTTKDRSFLPSSSLSLSMSCRNNNNNNNSNGVGANEEDENVHNGSNVSWMNVTSEAEAAAAAPGGPLGEALCLGNYASGGATWGRSNLVSSPSHHGYSSSNNNSNNTNSSSCSKGSCEDGGHALSFIG